MSKTNHFIPEVTEVEINATTRHTESSKKKATGCYDFIKINID